MKMTPKFVTSLIVLTFMFSSLSMTAVASATQQFMITSFINKSKLVSDQHIQYEIHVSTIDPSKPSETLRETNDADVYLYFKNGSTLIKKRLKNGKQGVYKGAVNLPISGEWQILIMATHQGQSPDSITTEGPETMKTTWNVQTPSHKSGWFWASTVGIMLIVLFILFRWLRRRKV